MAAEYPEDLKSYQFIAKIGSGASGMVYKAICLTMPPSPSSTVAIKCIDVDQTGADFESETKTISLLNHSHNHPNILRVHCSFTEGRRIWVVMPYMSTGSAQSIITSDFPTGVPEMGIIILLKEILKALIFLHDQRHVHGDVKPGNILIDSDGTVKLGGVSGANFDPSSRLKEVGGTLYWIAPEVIHSRDGFGVKADIWSFGITALELAHRKPPLSHLPPSKSLLSKITKRFRSFTTKGGVKMKVSEHFQDMVRLCLDQNPGKRPTAAKLLEHPFFNPIKNITSKDEILLKNMWVGLPSVDETFKKLSSVGSSCSEQEDAEEFVSGWNFNVEGFELHPVFPGQGSSTHRVKAEAEKVLGGHRQVVRFLEELEIIPDMKVLSMSSTPAIEEERAVGRVEGERQESSLTREETMGYLVGLRDSLDEQMKSVKEMMRIVGEDQSGGEETNREEEKEELKFIVSGAGSQQDET